MLVVCDGSTLVGLHEDTSLACTFGANLRHPQVRLRLPVCNNSVHPQCTHTITTQHPMSSLSCLVWLLALTAQNTSAKTWV